MKQIIEVTVKMYQDQLETFLAKNNIEEYTWRKGKITIDLTNMVQTSQKELATKTANEDKQPLDKSESQTQADTDLFYAWAI